MVNEAVNWQIPLHAKPVLSWVAVARHCPGPIDRFQIHGLWCMHLYRYSGVLRINGQEFLIRPGHASITPPSALLEFVYDDDPAVHIFAHFSLPRRHRVAMPIPAMQDLGPDFNALYRSMEPAIEAARDNPMRAEVRLWDVLWQLAKRAAVAQAAPVHPGLQAAMRLIDERLSRPIRVAKLAEEVGLSRNHLTRLFQESAGVSVRDYLRDRRVERARHLLIHSTRPIKAIAAEVGISDLQLFNKTLRRSLGRSPRQIRRG